MKNITNFTQENALTLINSTDNFPVDFELAWKWLGFSRKDSAKRTLIACGFEEGRDFLLLHNDVEQIEVEMKTSTKGRRKGEQIEEIWLTTECFKSWGMMAATERGKEVRKHFLECERKLKAVVAEHVALDKPRSLLDLPVSDLFRLAVYLDGVEYGEDVNIDVVKGIDPAYLDAPPEAVWLAHQKVFVENWSNGLLAQDWWRRIYDGQLYEEGGEERAEDAAFLAEQQDQLAELEARDGFLSAFDAFEATLSSHQLLGGGAPILEPAQLII
jgi:phage anti-repressor protein